MNRWLHTLNLSDVFHAPTPFPEKRDEMVRRIEALPIISSKLTEITAALATAATPDEWDGPWNEFYDWADRNRVWVRTFGEVSA
jgi:hypothetical protein